MRPIYRDTLRTFDGNGEVIAEERCDPTTGLPVADLRASIEQALAEANYVPPPPPAPPVEPSETPIVLRDWSIDRNTDFTRNKLVILRARGFFGVITHEEVTVLHTAIKAKALAMLADDADVKRLTSIRPQITEARREAAKLITACRDAKQAVIDAEKEAGPDLGKRLVELSAARDALLARSASLSAEVQLLESAEAKAMTAAREAAERALRTARQEAGQAEKAKEKEAISALEIALREHGPAMLRADSMSKKAMEGSTILRVTDMIDALLAK